MTPRPPNDQGPLFEVKVTESAAGSRKRKTTNAEASVA
jgi:hypothetical protein